jgi:hypothetical protein
LISDAVYSALNAFLPSDQRFPVTKRRLATALKKAGLLVDCAKGRNLPKYEIHKRKIVGCGRCL